jgi:cell division protein FtsB
MNDFKKHHISHDVLRFFAGVIVVGLLFVLTTAAVRAAYGMYQTFNIAAEGHASAELELTTLKEQERHVNATIAALNSERGVEEAVRERFGVVKPGEGEIRIVRDKDAETTGNGNESDNMFVRIFQSLFVW